MNKKSINLARLILNIIIVFMVGISIVSNFIDIDGISNNSQAFGCFKYFTILSNTLVCIFSFATIIYLLINRRNENSILSRPKYLLKYIACISVVLTFTVVMLFLGPTQGYNNMLRGNGIFVHLFVPILSVIDFILIKTNKIIGYKESLLTIVPTLLYSIVYFVMIVVVKSWSDFYGLLFGGNYFLAPISMIVMYASTYLLALLVRWFSIIFNKKIH